MNLRTRLAELDKHSIKDALIQVDDTSVAIMESIDKLTDACDSLKEEGGELLNDSGVISSYYFTDKMHDIRVMLEDINHKLIKVMDSTD